MITVLLPVALVLALLVTGAVFGGGFGKKQRGMSGPLHTNEPLVMAHRGDSTEHPENSREAFRAARENGFTAVEIDVKRSADGHFYLFHDRKSRRLLGVDIDLSRQSLDDLQQYSLHHKGQPTSQHVLSLEEFATEFGEDFIVYLDIKRHGNNDLLQLADDIGSFISRFDLRKRSIVGGDFLFTTLFEYRFPELHTSIGGPGDFRARTYRWIPKRFRPDFMIARADEISGGLVSWLRESELIDRWIVYGINTSNRDRIEQWGFSKLLVD